MKQLRPKERMTFFRRKAVPFWISFLVLLWLALFVYWDSFDRDGTSVWRYNSREKYANKEPKGVTLTTWFDPGAKGENLTLTPWLAPIIWEKAFNKPFLDYYYEKHPVTVGLTVFAVGKYLEKFMVNFLRSADAFFLPGHKVVIYLMVEKFSKVPAVRLGPQRQLRVFQVKRQRRWQDISTARMKEIGKLVKKHIRYTVDFLFCMDVDQVFKRPYGVEVLDESVAQLHPWFYKTEREDFPYERNPRSAAYIPYKEGDYYYHSAVFGGTPARVLHLTQECYKGIQRDMAQGMEAVWHDESHLNKYYLDHKPTKLLSPEYCWDYTISFSRDILSVKLAKLPKKDVEVRGND